MISLRKFYFTDKLKNNSIFVVKRGFWAFSLNFVFSLNSFREKTKLSEKAQPEKDKKDYVFSILGFLATSHNELKRERLYRCLGIMKPIPRQLPLVRE